MKSLFLVVVVVAVLLKLNSAHEHSADECWCQLETHLQDVTPSLEIQQLIEHLKSLNGFLSQLPLYEMLQDERLDTNLRKAGFIDDDQEKDIIDSCYDFLELALNRIPELECGSRHIAGAYSTGEILEVIEHHPKLSQVFTSMEACRAFIIN